MAQLASTDPSDIANAARCFSCNITGINELAVRTYLLTQLGNVATPPCITPTAPTFVQAKSVGPNNIFITWRQLSNSGSLITSYTIQWGTVSGVYTNSATVPVIPRAYSITGLTSGTQYFFVVKANSSAAVGCSSANSSEGNATTSGAAPSNGLLNNLISYWKFDDDEPAGSNTADSVGANPLTLSANATTGNTFCPGGIINGGCCLGNGSTSAFHTDNTDFSPGANTSFAISVWVNSTNWLSQPGVVTLVLAKANAGDSGAYEIYFDGTLNILITAMFDSGVVKASVNLASPPTNSTWHHVVFSFDSPAKQFKGYYDGALISTVSTTTTSMFVGALNFQIGTGAGHPALANMKMDEMAMWHKPLTQTDVTNLFNGGAALPLASFTV